MRQIGSITNIINPLTEPFVSIVKKITSKKVSYCDTFNNCVICTIPLLKLAYIN